MKRRRMRRKRGEEEDEEEKKEEGGGGEEGRRRRRRRRRKKEEKQEEEERKKEEEEEEKKKKTTTTMYRTSVSEALCCLHPLGVFQHSPGNERKKFEQKMGNQLRNQLGTSWVPVGTSQVPVGTSRVPTYQSRRRQPQDSVAFISTATRTPKFASRPRTRKHFNPIMTFQSMRSSVYTIPYTLQSRFLCFFIYYFRTPISSSFSFVSIVLFFSP